MTIETQAPEGAQAQAIKERDAYASELARCRDAFPIPAPGSQLEQPWSEAIGDPLCVADYIRAALAAPAPKAPVATIEDNSQNWAGMDGTTAWHLIERHADNWTDIGKMMGEWLAANLAAPSPAEAHGLDELRRDLIADTREVFDASGSETPQVVRDVIEYVDSWLQVQVGRTADRSKAQPKGTAKCNCTAYCGQYLMHGSCPAYPASVTVVPAPAPLTSVCHMECGGCIDAGKCAFPGKPAEPARYPHPDEDDAVTLWAEIHRLRAAVQGPDGYATWQEAATAERVRRVAAEAAQSPAEGDSKAALPPPLSLAPCIAEIPTGYRAVLVPEGEAPPEPDWDEAKRQAEVVTGLKVEQHTFGIIIREVRRWITQADSQAQPKYIGVAISKRGEQFEYDASDEPQVAGPAQGRMCAGEARTLIARLTAAVRGDDGDEIEAAMTAVSDALQRPWDARFAAAIAAPAPAPGLVLAPSDKVVWRLIDDAQKAEGLAESVALNAAMKRAVDAVLSQCSAAQCAAVAQPPEQQGLTDELRLGREARLRAAVLPPSLHRRRESRTFTGGIAVSDTFSIDACEEAFVRDFCPYKGSPDPLVVWRAAWKAAITHAVPPGHQVVPDVPTQQMCQEGQWKAKEWPKFPLRIVPIYQAMLNAAPGHLLVNPIPAGHTSEK